MKKALLPTLAATAAIATPAFAEFTLPVGDGGSLTFYGQLNPAIISVDDGQETETNLVDNDLSNSRVGLRFTLPSGENTFEFRLETALGLPNSTEVDQFGSFYSHFTREDIRHVDFSYSGSWGRVSAGQGSMAADGVAERDLSLVGYALYSYTADSNASFLFRDQGGVLSGPVVADTTDNFDGARRGRVRYDTPDFNGFSAAVAYGQNVLNQDDENDYYDIGLYYNGEIGGGAELSAALAYQERDDDDSRTDIVGSASILWQNGFSVTVAAGDRDDDAAGASDPHYYYAKVGYEADWISWGKTGIGLHYWDGSDFNEDGSDSDVWGVGVVQKVDQYNTTLYLTYQEYDYSDSSDEFQDLSTVVFGALWTF